MYECIAKQVYHPTKGIYLFNAQKDGYVCKDWCKIKDDLPIETRRFSVSNELQGLFIRQIELGFDEVSGDKGRKAVLPTTPTGNILISLG